MTLKDKREERWGKAEDVSALSVNSSESMADQQKVVFLNNNVVPIQPELETGECIGGVCHLNWSPKRKHSAA